MADMTVRRFASRRLKEGAKIDGENGIGAVSSPKKRLIIGQKSVEPAQPEDWEATR
jgi:hypothetical protein